MADLTEALHKFRNYASDFQDVLAANNGRELSDEDYYGFMVPLSKWWEIVYEESRNAEPCSLEDLIAGRASDYSRGMSKLRELAHKDWPFPMFAGEVTQTLCHRYEERLLRVVFARMLPKIDIVLRLWTSLTQDSDRETGSQGGKSGVSLRDLATILADHDQDLIPKNLKTFRNRRRLKPKPIGVDAEDKRAALYECGALSKFAKEIEGEEVCEELRVFAELRARERPAVSP